MTPRRKTALSFTLPAALGLLAGSAAPAWSQTDAGTVQLSDLLSNTGNALSVLTAEAETAAAREDVNREQAESGLHVMFGGGYGLVRNIVDTNRAFTYSEAQAMAGFSYPLLGAAELAHRRIDLAQGKQDESEIRAVAARRIAQLGIESNYARYWGAQESLKVTQAYVDSEDLVLSKLRLRAQNRMLLQSELLDAQNGFEQAKSDLIQFKRIEDDSRNRLARLTGRDLGAFNAVPVQLPASPQVNVVELVSHHPDIQALKAQRNAIDAEYSDSGWYGIDASIDVTGTGVKDVSQHGPNGGLAYAGLTVKAPVGVFSARAAERRRLKAQSEELNLKIQDRSQELSGELHAAEQQIDQAQQDSTQMAQRIQSSSESLRESYLRGNVFAEEGAGTMARRLQQYYKDALQDIDAQTKAWQANVYLRGYSPADSDMTPSPSTQAGTAGLGAQLADPIIQVEQTLQGGGGHGAKPQAQATPYSGAEGGARAAYAGPMLAPQVHAQTVSLPHLRAVTLPAAGAQMQDAVYRTSQAPAAVAVSDAPAPPAGAAAAPRLLMASAMSVAQPIAPAPGEAGPGMAVYVWKSAELVDRQGDEKLWQGLRTIPINRLLLAMNGQQISEAQVHPDKLRSFIAAAKQHGVAVELLLGEPSWIEAAQRPKLVAIIDGLRGLPFDGLNLDIEPDQLYKQPITMAQFDAWMETLHAAAQASPWPTSVSIHPRYFRDPPFMSWNVAERLRQAGVREAVLMIYNSNPQKVADIARPIVSAPNGLRFRVAQSVEPELEPQLSYAKRSPQDFHQSMQQLQGLLAQQPNTDGVVVQAWNDLMRMGYESQVR
jgi:outer membrane protein TolC